MADERFLSSSKTAEISYTLLQKDFLKKVGIESVRFYCNGYNLLTLFSDLNDIDIDPKESLTEEIITIRIYGFTILESIFHFKTIEYEKGYYIFFGDGCQLYVGLLQ